MLKFTFNVATLCIVSLFMVGCAELFPEPLPQYKSTKLSQEAHTIIFSPSKPMGCIFVGEIEGRANAVGTRGATIDLLETSAKNDLRNNAVHLKTLGENKRYIIYIARKTAKCMQYVSGQGTIEIDCYSHLIPKEQKLNPNSYRVYGDIYECKW